LNCRLIDFVNHCFRFLTYCLLIVCKKKSSELTPLEKIYTLINNFWYRKYFNVLFFLVTFVTLIL